MQRHSMSSWGIVIWANWISPTVLRSSQSRHRSKSKIKFPTFLLTTNNQVAHKTAFLIFHFHGCHMLCRAVAHIHEAHGIIATLSVKTNAIDQPLPVLEEMRRCRSIFVSGDSLLLQVEHSWTFAANSKWKLLACRKMQNGVRWIWSNAGCRQNAPDHTNSG